MGVPHQKTNMTMESPPFEDVFPNERGDFPMLFLSFQGSDLAREMDSIPRDPLWKGFCGLKLPQHQQNFEVA